MFSQTFSLLFPFKDENNEHGSLPVEVELLCGALRFLRKKEDRMRNVQEVGRSGDKTGKGASHRSSEKLLCGEQNSAFFRALQAVPGPVGQRFWRKIV